MQSQFRKRTWRWVSPVTATVATLATLVTLVGCQSDTSPMAAPDQVEPAIGVQLSSPALSVYQGESVSIVVNVWRSGGFTGAIALDVRGEPDGVTPVLDAPVVLMGSSSCTLTLEATDTMEPGTYTLTVIANGTGVDEESASLVLTVMPALTQSIRISLSSETLSITRGQSSSVGVSVFRIGGYTGTVTLAVTGAPVGVTGTFYPVAVPPGATASTLALATAASTAAGAYTLTITASGPDVTSKDALLLLNVTDPLPPSIGVRFVDTDDFIWIVRGDTVTTWSGVTVTRYGGYTGAVELSAEGLPSDIQATFHPNPLDANTTTSDITFIAVPSVGLGDFNVTIRAKGAGVPDATTVFRLLVAPPWPL